MVGLLKGSFVFMAELMKNIDLDFTIDFMQVSSYGSCTISSGQVKVLSDITSSVEGKNILIVEDIIDTGNTLKFVYSHLSSKGAKSIKVVTLCDKPSRRVVDFEADYVGITIADNFIAGYGLDYDEKYRNLPYIGVVENLEAI